MYGVSEFNRNTRGNAWGTLSLNDWTGRAGEKMTVFCLEALGPPASVFYCLEMVTVAMTLPLSVCPL